MNIFKQELKMKRKSILIWSISIAAFIIFYMAFFPGISQESVGLEAIMDNFPDAMLETLGLREGLAISELLGFFTLTFSMVQLAIAIQSANYGFAILSEEERELTADFLMTKPITRSKIYWSKFFASFLGLVITSIIIGIASLIALELFNGGDSYNFINLFKLLITIPIFQLFFLSVGMFISILFKRIQNVLSFSMTLTVGLFIVDAVRGIIGSDFLGYLTPFNYFEPGVILKTGEYDLKLFLVAIVIITISLVASYFIYNKRDINPI